MHSINSQQDFEFAREDARAMTVWSIISVLMLGLVLFGVYHVMTRDEMRKVTDVTGLVRTNDYAAMHIRDDWMGRVQGDWE